MKTTWLVLLVEICDDIAAIRGQRNVETDRLLAKAERIRALDGCFERDDRRRHRSAAAKRAAAARRITPL